MDRTVSAVAGEAVAADEILGYRPHPALTALVPVFERLARALGSTYEIVLHDLRYPERSVCGIAGKVTGRSVGAPATNVLLQAVQEQGDAVEDVFNYPTTVTGRRIRSSILFVRDDGHVIGAICVNVDVGALDRLREEVDDLIGLDRLEPPRAETFDNSVGDLVQDMLAATLEKLGVRRTRSTPEERMAVVASLDQQGTFRVRGAVDLVARELRVSKFTVYSYLHRLKGREETRS